VPQGRAAGGEVPQGRVGTGARAPACGGVARTRSQARVGAGCAADAWRARGAHGSATVGCARAGELLQSRGLAAGPEKWRAAGATGR
jgi:hypothetical protein